MKSMIKYIYIAVVAILFASCTPDSLNEDGVYGSDGEGAIGIDFHFDTKSSATLDDDSIADLLDTSVLKIYNSAGALIRRYEPATECPDEIYLLADEYDLTLSIGSGNAMTTDSGDMSFYGESSLTITPDEVDTLSVTCNILNSKISVVLDEGLDVNLESGYSVSIAAAQSVSDDLEDKFTFTTDSTGYFILADDAKTIAWRFEGTRIDGVAIVAEGTIAGEAGEAYTLTFEYDKYLNMGGIIVDTETEDKDDHFSFSLQPTISSVGFTASEVQVATTESFSYEVSGQNPLTNIVVVVNDVATTLDTATETENGYVSYVKVSDYSGTLTIDSDIIAAASFTGGEHEITVMAYDSEDEHGTKVLTVAKSGICTIDTDLMDLWYNTGKISICNTDPSVTPTLKYGVSGDESNWKTLTLTHDNNYYYTAQIAPEWSSSISGDLTRYSPIAGTGVWADTAYGCSLAIGDQSYTSQFTTDGAQSIPNGDMESSDLICWDSSSKESSDWASGNNSWAESLCSQGTYTGMGGSKCAVLASTDVSMVDLAAGNLFLGQFYRSSALSTSADVYFGQKFDWASRPKSFKFKYAASLGTVDASYHSGSPLSKGDPDQGIVFLAIVDWSKRHTVTSGTSSPSGIWNPSTMTQTSGGEGPIIGYAIKYITESVTTSMVEEELDIYYYDTETKPSGNYTIVISCASSAYGDYMTGSTSSKLWIDDFEFGY